MQVEQDKRKKKEEKACRKKTRTQVINYKFYDTYTCKQLFKCVLQKEA